MKFLRVCGSVSLGLFVACSSGSSDDQADGGDRDGPPTNPDGGDGSGDIEEYASGTRIKARVARTPDGAKALLGWRDITLNADCYFSAAIDGTMRCIPTGPPYNASIFADGSCALPAALGPSGAYHNPKYAPETLYTTNPPRTRVYELGVVIIAAYVRSGSNCVQTTMLPGYTYYARLGEVAPTTFQSATETLE